MSATTVSINGGVELLEERTTVADVVARFALSPKGTAVAVNAAVVPRSTWSRTFLCEGDRIELLTAAQGG